MIPLRSTPNCFLPRLCSYLSRHTNLNKEQEKNVGVGAGRKARRRKKGEGGGRGKKLELKIFRKIKNEFPQAFSVCKLKTVMHESISSRVLLVL